MDSTDVDNATFNPKTGRWEFRLDGIWNTIIFADSKTELRKFLKYVEELREAENEERLPK